MTERKPILLCMGNPLLDISVVADESLLKKYDLKANDAILAEEKHKPLYEELVKSYKPDYVAGGAAQNVARAAQPNSTVYFGCVGNDQFAEQMRNAAQREGLIADYLVTDEYPTGTCGVIITNNH
ncbi:15350_t:CDS:2, partial [Dentiscutata heterogama]